MASVFRFWKLFLGTILLLTLFILVWFLFTPPSKETVTREIFIKKGMPLRKIAQSLREEGIIRNEKAFVGLATVLGRKKGIQAGEYELHTRMLPLEVLKVLRKGQVKRHLVTLPEGYTLKQIAQVLADLGIIDQQTFLQKATSAVTIASLGLPPGVRSSLEGYLFPETYHLYREMEPEEIIQMMIQQFRKRFDSTLIAKASALGMAEQDAVILASIIEKETGFDDEKPLISAVFHNRLKINMPLQSDPTIIYGLKDFNGNLTREDLQRPSPYNTYLHSGLPPTPICNPGKSSLVAALSPAPVPYLYFVSKNDGSHQFSARMDEHNRAVAKYQKKNSLTKK